MKKREAIRLYLNWTNLYHVDSWQGSSVSLINLYTSDNYVKEIKELYHIGNDYDFLDLSELHMKVLIMGYCKECGISFGKTKNIIYPILKSNKAKDYIIWLREELLQDRLPLYDELFSKMNEICDWKEPVIKRRKRKKRWHNKKVYLKWFWKEFNKMCIEEIGTVHID